MKEIKDLHSSNTSQESDIPAKIIKENTGTFPDLFIADLQSNDQVFFFSTSLKLANNRSVHKMAIKFKRKLEICKHLAKCIRNLRKVALQTNELLF